MRLLVGGHRHLRGAAAAGIARPYSLLQLLPRARPLVPREERAPPPPLPNPKYIDVDGRCQLEYIEVPPAQELQDDPVTMVMVHGAPGKYQDFRYLIPAVRELQPQTRVLGLNLPGFGGSKVHAANYYDDTSALQSARLTLKALTELCQASRNVFLVGHSFGGHTAINVAAMNMLAADRALDVKGVALLASAGCRPHRVLRPKENAMLVNVLRARIPLLSSALPHMIMAIYTKLLGFADGEAAPHYVAGIVRAGTTDFGLVREHVELLRREALPAFMSWSQSDEYMEHEIPAELGRIGPPGPRLAFVGGGHNIQKTRADEIARAIHEWTASVLSGESPVVECETQVRP